MTRWEPPETLAYLWHLRQDRADATEVEISFRPAGTEVTHVEIEHRGWERLGARADELLERNHAGWDSLLPHFIAASEKGGT